MSSRYSPIPAPSKANPRSIGIRLIEHRTQSIGPVLHQGRVIALEEGSADPFEVSPNGTIPATEATPSVRRLLG